MSFTTLATASEVTKFRKQIFKEYLRQNRFKRYMGTTENSVIQVLEDLTKGAGDKISVPFVRRLTQDAITGSSTLEGAEESMLNYAHTLTVDMRRNAVLVPKMDRIKSEFDLFMAAKERLKLWAMEDLRNLISQAFLSPHVDGDVSYDDASEGQKDAFCAANNPATANQRILFGSVKSNSSGDHSADLAKVDSTNDKLDKEALSLLRRMAQTANPHISPIRVNEDEEWYVAFCGSRLFRDLKTDLQTLHSSGQARDLSNPLWRPGDLQWDGVIVREVPELDTPTSTFGGGLIETVGAGTPAIDVGPIFLCGAQAVGVGYAEKLKPVSKEFDYDSKYGCAVEHIMGVEKLSSNDVMNGVATGYFAAVGDS